VSLSNAEQEPVSGNTDRDDISLLRREILRLQQLVNSLNTRISSIEREHGILPVDFEAIEPESQIEEVFEPPEEKPKGDETLVEEEIETPVAIVETWVSPVEETTPVSTPAVQKEPSAIQREWEQILGGNWLARIGVFTLIIGAAFFLKFAFDRNWLGPLGRVILGVVAGFIMLGGGHYWRRKYPTFAQAISGGGIALLYLSVFAAYAAFGLIGVFLAIILLFCVSALSAVIAVRYNSMALAILGIIGAFLAPLVLTISSNTGTSDPAISIWLLAYVFIVDIGVLCLSTFRNWKWFNILAFAGSVIIYGVWYYRFGGDVSLLTSQGSLTVIFLIFVGVTTLYHVLWRRNPDSLDYTLMVANATGYYCMSFGLLWHDYRAWLGGFTFLLALFYGGLAYLLNRESISNSRLAVFALGIALLLFTVAIPVQIGDRAWTTIAWSAQATVLMWISLKTGLPRLRIPGYLVYIAAFLRLMIFDTDLPTRLYVPVLNERVLAFLISIALLYITAVFLKRRDSVLTEYEHSTIFNYRFFMVAANIFSLWIIVAEVVSYLHSSIPPGEEWQISLLIPLAGITLLNLGIWKRPQGYTGFVLLLVDAIVFYIVSVMVGTSMNSWAGLMFCIIAILFGLFAWMFKPKPGEDSTSFQLVIGIALLSINIAVPVQLGDVAWTTVIWAAEGALLVWLSFRFRFPLYRYFGYTVFFAVLARLWIWDSHVAMSSFVPFANERFLAYSVSIAAFFTTAFIVRRNYDLLPDNEKTPFSVYPVFLVITNALILIILSMEIWGYFSREIYDTQIMDNIRNIRSARNLSLTAIWAVYSIILLVLGISRRSRYMRLAGLALFTIPIVKVYVYDVFALEQVYRIFAFVGLGILLVVSGYLYNRYKEAIKDFITEK